MFVPHASEIYEILSFLTKKQVFFLNHFWGSVDAILKDVSEKV